MTTDATYEEMNVLIAEKLGIDEAAFTSGMCTAWPLVELMAERMQTAAYTRNEDFRFAGPTFKSTEQYLTHEGYPLGTTCWVMDLICDGFRLAICAPTPALAVCLAVLQASQVKIGPWFQRLDLPVPWGNEFIWFDHAS